MSKINILMIILLLIPLLLVTVPILLESKLTLYEYRSVFIFENKGDEIVNVGLGRNIKEFVALNIAGWQKLEKIAIYANGKDITHQCKIVEYKGSFIIETPLYELKPGETVNITVLQFISANWAEGGLTLNRKFRTLSMLEKRELTNSFNGTPLTYLTGFWVREGENSSWSAVIELSESLGRNVSSVPEYVHAVAKWVDEHIIYDKETFQIKYPSKTLYEKRGACGDRAALVTALLRLKGIPSFMCLSIVYEEGVLINESTESLSLSYRNAALHVFSMACEGETCVPIDTTVKMNYGESPYVDGAGVNISDRVLILAKMIGEDPNDYLTITLPSNSLRLTILKTLKRIQKIEENLLVLLVIYVLLGVIVVLYIRNAAE